MAWYWRVPIGPVGYARRIGRAGCRRTMRGLPKVVTMFTWVIALYMILPWQISVIVTTMVTLYAMLVAKMMRDLKQEIKVIWRNR